MTGTDFVQTVAILCVALAVVLYALRHDDHPPIGR